MGFFDIAGAATASHRPRPASILLKQEGRYSDSRNETTATAKSMGGYTMAVSFWVANPPDLSFFSVRCSKPPNSFKSPDFKVFPHVVGMEGPFVLLRARFYGFTKDEYFMYTAVRDSKQPSLDWIAPPSDDNRDSLSRVREFGIVPCEYGCNYLLVALCDAPSDYKLRLYSSERKSWNTMTLFNPCPEVKRIVPEKVIRTGEGSLGWVDFSYGLLVCDLRQKLPWLQFIPLPEPLPENRGRLKACHPGVSARWFRDLICVNGVLKFIEMEHRFKGTEQLIDPSNRDVLFDSDLIMSLRHRDMDEKHKSRDGWRAFTWTRTVWCDYWSNRCTFDVADILVKESFYPSLLSGLRATSVGKFTFNDMYSAFPTLSPDGSILYLKSMEEPNDKNGWVVTTIDLGNKTMKALGVYSFENPHPSSHAFHLSNLADHLNMSPGIEVSACVKTAKGESSANDPDDKSGLCEWLHFLQINRGKPRPPSALAGTKRARNEAQCSIQNDHISQYRPCGDSNIDSTLKLRRLLIDGKLKHTRNEGQRVVQNDHVPWVHPFQDLRCFSNLDLYSRRHDVAVVSSTLAATTQKRS